MLDLTDIFSIVIIFLVIYFYKNRKFYYLSLKLPGPIAFPLIGNAMNFFCENDEIFEKMVNIVSKYPSPFRVWLGPKFVIVFSDADQAAKILDSSNFSHKDEVYRFMKIFNGEGLISGSGIKWKKDRRLMARLFTKSSTESYFLVVCKHVNILTHKLDAKVNKNTFNVEKFLHRCCADFVNESILGIKTDAQNGSQLDTFLKAVDRMYDIVHARIVKVWLQLEFIFKFTHYFKEQEDGKRELHGFLQKAIRNKLSQRSNGFYCNNALLDRILDIRDSHPDFATEDEMIHHMNTLYTASEDTVTTITAFTLVLMGMYPEIQGKTYNEIVSVVGHKDFPDLEDLSKLTFTEMCLKEVLRLFPIAPFILRTTHRDFELDKWTIPEGCSVAVAIHNIHRNPKYWDQPNSFHPEHFLPENIAKRHPYAYLPFSAGPRGCLGKSYAFMALKILLISILKKYQIEADGTLCDIKLKTDISVRPCGRQFPIRIRLRNV